MPLRANLSAWAAVVLMTAGAETARAQPPTPKVEDEFVRALQRRQDAVKNVRVEWTSTRWEPKGARSDALRGTGLGERANPGGHDLPPADVTYPTKGLYCIEGKRVRYEYENWTWSQDGKGTPLVSTGVDVLDGEKMTSFGVYPGPESERRQGNLIADKSYASVLAVALLPLTLSVRGVSADYCFIDTAAFRATGNRANIVGADCVELRLGEAGSPQQLWVDPARGYVPVRWTILDSNGTATEQIDTDYAADPTLGWVPSGWKHTSRHGGKVSATERAEVTSFLVNSKLPADQFTVKFPERTRVNDEINQRKWIVRPDGGQRVILPGEEWATDDELLATTPGAAPGAVPQQAAPLWRRYWLPAVLVVVVAALLAFGARAFLRRRSSRADSPTGRGGFSLVELLVVIAIVGVLLALTLAAVQQVRAASYRVACQNNMRQIALGLHQFHAAHGVLPPGFVDLQSTMIDGKFYPLPFDGPYPLMPWQTRVLPHVGESALWAEFDAAYANPAYPAHADTPQPIVGPDRWVGLFVCIADGRRRPVNHYHQGTTTSYLGVSGTRERRRDGVLYPDSKVRLGDIADGTASTLMVGERPPGPNHDFGRWYPGGGDKGLLAVTEAVPGGDGTLGCPAGPYAFGPGRVAEVCDVYHYWSLHPGGGNFAFADGSVRFLPYSTTTLPALATRAGGEPAAE